MRIFYSQGLSLLMLSVKIDNFLYKSCLLYVLLTQRSSGISRQKLHICIFVAYTISNFDQIATTNWDNACRWPNGTSMWPRSLYEPSIHHGLSSMRWWSSVATVSPIGTNEVWHLRDVGSLPRISIYNSSRNATQSNIPTHIQHWSEIGHIIQTRGGYEYEILMTSCTDKQYIETTLQQTKQQVINIHDIEK